MGEVILKNLLFFLMLFMFISAFDDLNLDDLNLDDLNLPSNNEEKIEMPMVQSQENGVKEDKEEQKEKITNKDEKSEELSQDSSIQEEVIEYKQNEEASNAKITQKKKEDKKAEQNKELEEELKAFEEEEKIERDDIKNQNTEKKEDAQHSKKALPKIQLEETISKQEVKEKGKEIVFTQEDFFDLDEDDFSLEKQKDYYAIKILSLDLEAFVSGKTYNEKNQVQTFGVNDNFTQIVSQDGKIQEYKFFQKTSKKNTIFNRTKFPLEKIDFDTYKIVMQDTPNSFDISSCRIIIKKELNATLNQNKEVIMDLDIKRELRNTSKFTLFLDCPK